MIKHSTGAEANGAALPTSETSNVPLDVKV
jgi:hypothetical protein